MRGICATHPVGSVSLDAIGGRDDDALLGERGERPHDGRRSRRRGVWAACWLAQASSSGIHQSSRGRVRTAGWWRCAKANRRARMGRSVASTPSGCERGRVDPRPSGPQVGRMSTSVVSTRPPIRLVSALGWSLVALAGAGALAFLALSRGEQVSAAWLLVAALCTYAIGYRFYSAFISARVFALDDARLTPAERLNDGRDFVPTNRWIVFGHHFAAIAGPGPLVGPTLAAQFGYLPGVLWIVVGVVLGGAVQDIRHPVRVDPPRREIARPDGEGGDRPGRRLHRARRRARHHDRADRRARARRRERAQVESVGHRDDRAHDPDRDAHGRLHALDPARSRARGDGDRSRAARRRAVRRTLGRRAARRWRRRSR